MAGLVKADFEIRPQLQRLLVGLGLKVLQQVQHVLHIIERALDSHAGPPTPA